MPRSDAGKLSLILLLTPFVLWIGLLIVLPQVGHRLHFASREGRPAANTPSASANYVAFINEPIYWNTLLRTGVDVACLVTILALFVGFPIAYYIAKIAQARSRAALFLLCLIPLWVSDLVRAFGWIVLLRETGIVSERAAIGGARSMARSRCSTTTSPW